MFAEGHEIVAIIAADNLTPAAQAPVARILGVPDEAPAVANAMAAASIRPARRQPETRDRLPSAEGLRKAQETWLRRGGMRVAF
jgi:hypothetical protein